jgi:hypothetical protein
MAAIAVWAQKIYYLRRHSLRMKLAISLADMKQKAFNKRYFVMLMETSKGEKLVSINRNELVRIKRKGWLPKTFGYLELQQEAFYQTDLARNNKATRHERAATLRRYRRYIEKNYNTPNSTG